jgi:hypothetical protein
VKNALRAFFTPHTFHLTDAAGASQRWSRKSGTHK